MKIEKKMFVTDLDGTLFTDEKMIHGKDLAALESLGMEGITRVFATGRSLYSFQKAIQAMGFSSTCNDYNDLDNGRTPSPKIVLIP